MCFGVNTPSLGSSEFVPAKVMFTPDQRTISTPNQELHMRPHLPRFYHNNTLLYCIL
jgi:hypothetical protein